MEAMASGHSDYARRLHRRVENLPAKMVRVLRAAIITSEYKVIGADPLRTFRCSDSRSTNLWDIRIFRLLAVVFGSNSRPRHRLWLTINTRFSRSKSVHRSAGSSPSLKPVRAT